MDLKLIIVILLALGAAGFMMFRPTAPVEISEAKAKEIAERGLREFCKRENASCAEYAFKNQEPSTDSRYHWSFHYVAVWATPKTKVIIYVGKLGNYNMEMMEYTPPEGEATAEAPPSAAPAGESPPAEAPRSEAQSAEAAAAP